MKGTDAKVAKVIEDEVRRIEREDDLEEDARAYFRVPPAKDPSQVYSIRISVDKLEKLRKLAERRGVPPSALIRDLVEERLESERGGDLVSVRLAKPVYKKAIESARRAGISLEEFAQQSIALMAGSTTSSKTKAGAERRPGKKKLAG